MTKNSYNDAVLLLSDGTKFYGKSTGVEGIIGGEIAFNTGMTGYQEIFTDPSYLGQILVTSTSHIGNYGMHATEIESEGIKIAGLVCKKFSDGFSRPAGEESIYNHFQKQNLIGICDLDTRAIVRHIRNAGAMNAIICTKQGLSDEELQAELDKVPSMEGLELSSRVSTEKMYSVEAPNATHKVAVLDYGVKKNILRCLNERGISTDVYPYNAKASDILSKDYDGIMLSNGPGDPEAMPNEIEQIKEFVASGKPIFGICLGHQLLALSQGLKTEKMFNGHRGINHPIKNLISGKCEVVSQNHGFVVSKASVEASNEVELTHIHLNDDTVAGISLKNKDVFSVQYHPEASPGPHDSRYLFDQFLENLNKNK